MREPIIQGNRDHGDEDKAPAESKKQVPRQIPAIDSVDEKLRPQRLDRDRRSAGRGGTASDRPLGGAEAK